MYGGFAPRLGAVYALNDKTVLRSGWGIFYMQAFYPGWGGGHLAGRVLERRRSFSTSLGGIEPAFFLEQGLPQNFTRPPLTSRSDYRNGQGIYCTARSTPTSVRTRTSGTSRWIASSGATSR